MTTHAVGPITRADVRRVFDGRPGGLSIAAEPGRGILTCTLPGGPGRNGECFEPLLVKVPTDPAASHAVQHEARLLVELRRMRLGPIERTIPRHVGMRSFDGLPAAVSSTVPGRPMARRRWLHTTQPWVVRRDFEHAAAWLASLQDASSTSPVPSTWAADVTAALQARWPGHRLLGAALAALAPSVERLDGHPVDRTAVHGDFWHGNVMVDPERGVVTGVVDWTAGELEGSPLSDLARFGLRYALDASGAALVLLGRGWYPRTVRSYLRAGLGRLGVPEDRWYDVALVGIAEIAARHTDADLAEDHLVLLSALPARPQQRATERP